jgi:hypothetical protein
MSQEPAPDRPVAFGYKQQWLAIEHRDPQTVADALGLKDAKPSTWKEGIDRVYALRQRQPGEGVEVFISPTIVGWTFAVGGVGIIPSVGMSEFVPFLCDLSAELGTVQYFGNHRVSCYAAWAKTEGGRIVRAYSAVDYRTRINIGDPTSEEIDLGFDFLDEEATPADVEAHEAKGEADRLRMEVVKNEIEAMKSAAEARGEAFDESIWDEKRFESQFDRLVPNEDSVMLLAGRWSIDPMRLEEIEGEAGLGLIGTMWTAKR